MIFKSRAARSRTTRWNFNESIVRLMNPTTLSQIAKLAGGLLSFGDGTIVIDKVSTDSRTLKGAQLFVALRREEFGGHNFLDATARKGAAGVVVESDWDGESRDNVPHVRFGRYLE